MKTLILVVRGAKLKLHTTEARRKSFHVLKQQIFGFCWTHIRFEAVNCVSVVIKKVKCM